MSTFTPELTFGQYQSGMMADGTSNYRTIQITGGSAPNILYQSSALTTYRTARTNRASSPCNIAVLGDSWVQGFNTYTYGSRWVDLLAVNLRSAFPTTGATSVNGSTFWQAVYPAFANDGIMGGLTAWSSVIGTGGALGTSGIGGQSVQLNSAGNGYRYTFTGTSFDLHFLGGIGVPPGIASITIDGGSTTLLDSQAYSTAVQSWSSPGLSNGVHTIDITLSSGTAFFYCGFMFYRADENKGIRTINAGHSGYFASNTALMNLYNTAGGLQPLTPSLAIIALTLNDYNAQTALATYKTDVQAAVANARTSAANASLPVLLLAYNQPANFGTLGIPYTSYAAKLREIADADALVAVLDLASYVPLCANSGPPDPLGFWDSDRLHPTGAIGHPLLASLLAAQLSY